MAYLVRRLLENTANESFLQGDASPRRPGDDLLVTPQEVWSHADAERRPNAIAHAPDSGESPGRFRTSLDRLRARRRAEIRCGRRSKSVRGRSGRPYPLVIGGDDGSHRPRVAATRSTRSHLAQSWGRSSHGRRRARAKQAVAAARAAFPPGAADAGDRERAGRARSEAADDHARRRFELAAWEVYECGKPWAEADADVAEAIDFCDYYAREMMPPCRSRALAMCPARTNVYRAIRAACVAVVIAPWNFPLAILTGMTAAALVTGNPVIMKPAEQIPVIAAPSSWRSSRRSASRRASSTICPASAKRSARRWSSIPTSTLIAFTGSRDVGLSDQSRRPPRSPPGQDHVKHVIAEMGGKNAIIVDDDADLDEAVLGVVQSAFGYAGQKCSACSRAIVLRTLYDTFLSRLVEATRRLKIGPAEDPGYVRRPGDRRRTRTPHPRIPANRRGTKAGSLSAGDPGGSPTEGYFVGPHIFADVPPAVRASPRRRSSARCWPCSRPSDLERRPANRQRHRPTP